MATSGREAALNNAPLAYVPISETTTGIPFAADPVVPVQLVPEVVQPAEPEVVNSSDEIIV